MNKLALFDIDGTLTKGFQGHARAFSEAFKKVYGIDTAINVINVQGMTDQQIIIEVLKKKGLNEQKIKSKIKICMEVMIDSFNKIIDSDEITLLDGVQELLEELNNCNILIGLVTGNLEPIGRNKLRKVGVNHYFKIGGFGNDDINRTNLVKLAIKRAGKDFSFELNNNVFLFGDAPQDIKAGKEARVKTIGVTTGPYSKQQLKNAGADLVLENFRDTKKILKIIRG